MMFLISSTGHSWREVEDEWDFPRLQRWIEYCAKHPPLQTMVAAYLGLNKPEPIRLTEDNFKQFIDALSMENHVGR